MKTFLFFVTDKLDERSQMIILKADDIEQAIYIIMRKLNYRLDGIKIKGETIEGDFFVKDIRYEED